MIQGPLSIFTFPRAVLHIDGDAFFASCEQARDPALKGKPVITGQERGIASSMSYEAKARGVKRAMRLSEIKKICPDVVMLPSDYETYSLLSKRFYEIVRRFTPEVEEYGIDECFADITGLRRPLGMSYEKIAEKIKKELDDELGFTFSVGLGPNKSIAKIGSKWKKPSGLTVIAARDIHRFIKDLPLGKIWGVGKNTEAYLQKEGLQSALDFAQKSEQWVKQKLTKPHHEIHQELNGHFVLKLETKERKKKNSIQKVRTFTPPSSERQFVFSQLSKNIENACIKARRHQQAAREVIFFLKRQDFRSRGARIKFSRPSCYASEIVGKVNEVFDDVFEQGKEYRSTGIILWRLTTEESIQPTLFESPLKIEKMIRLHAGIDEVKEKFGKHTVFLGSSFWAHVFDQHAGERGTLARRKKISLPGERGRKKLNIPLFWGEVS